MKATNFAVGETYKLYALWDFDKTGKYDVFEVIIHEGELAFFNHTDRCVYGLEFLGWTELVKMENEKTFRSFSLYQQ